MFLFLVEASSNSAHAYLSYNYNQNLRQELASQPYRILPINEKWAFAIDADFYKPVFLNNLNSESYTFDFNHGNGYWLDLRAEFSPVRNLVFNLKTTFTQGTSSNGPSYLFTPFARVGVSYRFGEDSTEHEIRLSDIDRQTIGNGIFVEDKVIAGGYWKSTWDETQLRFLIDGTGTFQLDGGMYATELSFFNRGLGASLYLFEAGRFGDYNTSPTGTVFGRLGGGNLTTGFEGAFNYRSWAGLVYLKWRVTSEPWSFEIKPQVRYYAKKIMGNLAGDIENVYVAYELNDTPFMNFMSIMSYGDDVLAYGSLAKVSYRPNHFYQLYFEGEPTFLAYRGALAPLKFLFFRTGFKLYPMQNREDALGFLIGNKYLAASSSSFGFRRYTTPVDVDIENRSIFIKQLYMMFNFEVHF